MRSKFTWTHFRCLLMPGGRIFSFCPFLRYISVMSKFRKFFVLLLLCTFSLHFSFADGMSERQMFLQQLPLLLNQQENTQQGISTQSSDPVTENIEKLKTLYRYLENNYLWDIDHDKTYEAMATALFESLGDRYTYYVTAEESADYMEDTTGQYGGLGFYFSKTVRDYQDPDDPSTLYCNISQVFPESPAAKGGIIAGDFITHINGESVIELSSTECSSKMKGLIGTSVTVTILRNSVSFDLTLQREKISVPSTESTMLEGKIGYIQIIQFYSQTADAVKDALSQLQKEGMEALIIDLRGCPGGDVNSALETANLFISGANLLSVNYKDASKNKTYKAGNGIAVSSKLPVVILIDGNSASSSEILASTMKDNNRAVLIGTTSYGKGIMQSISSFYGGDISVTVASFVPPSGNAIHENGVTPDIEIPAPSVPEDKGKEYSALVSGQEINDFITQYPEYTKENVELFIETHPDTGLPPEVVRILVRNVYYSKMPYGTAPKADTWFDPQIIAAVEYLNSVK